MEFLLVILVVAIIGFVAWNSMRSKRTTAAALEDAQADARATIERLSGQVNNLVGSNEAAQQALADAGERYNAAGSQIAQATSPAQARLAKQTALEGLYYTRAARIAMDMDPGPAIPELDGQRQAGSVTEDREVDVNGQHIAASPGPSDRTPNYYPGGVVAGRPVPSGWYSEPWWKPALVAGAWGVGSYLVFSSLFAGMSGVGAGVVGDAALADGGYDGSDGFDGGDSGDFGGDFGGGDFGGDFGF